MLFYSEAIAWIVANDCFRDCWAADCQACGLMRHLLMPIASTSPFPLPVCKDDVEEIEFDCDGPIEPIYHEHSA